LDGCEKKGFAGKGIRKIMKTKGGQNPLAHRGGRTDGSVGPSPHFWPKRLQVIENKEWGTQKESGEAASIERLRVRLRCDKGDERKWWEEKGAVRTTFSKSFEEAAASEVRSEGRATIMA
jgi:hypothetical protein